MKTFTAIITNEELLALIDLIDMELHFNDANILIPERKKLLEDAQRALINAQPNI